MRRILYRENVGAIVVHGMNEHTPVTVEVLFLGASDSDQGGVPQLEFNLIAATTQIGQEVEDIRIDLPVLAALVAQAKRVTR